MAVTLPGTLQVFDFDAMPTFSATELKAGDIVLLRYHDFTVTKLIGFFSHIMLCYERNGVVYTTEATPLKYLDIDGSERYIPTRLPTDSIAKYNGSYCVRRLKVPLTTIQKENLAQAVEKHRNGVYDNFLFFSYWLGLTPFSSIVSHDKRYFCSEYVTTLLNVIFDNNISHPILKTPSIYTSRYRSLLDVEIEIDRQYTVEYMPLF